MEQLLGSLFKDAPLWGILILFLYQEMRSIRKTKRDVNYAHMRIRELMKQADAAKENINSLQAKLVEINGKEGYVELNHV